MKFAKYILIIGLIGILYFVSTKVDSCSLLKKNTICLRVLKGEWKFKPEKITINTGQEWTLKIYNEDNFLHSFYINELKINETLPPEKETTIKIKSNEPGTYTFFCSIVCGEGHYRMNGQIEVK